jgi:hypothetical protein
MDKEDEKRRMNQRVNKGAGPSGLRIMAIITTPLAGLLFCLNTLINRVEKHTGADGHRD